MEEELHLFEQKVDGVDFWEYIRLYVFLELQRSLGLADIEPFQPARPWVRWARQLTSSLAGFLGHNPFCTTRKPLLFFGCPRRTRDTQGIWWDTTVDPFLDSLKVPYYYIERYCGDRHLIPARTRSIKYHEFLATMACGYRLATFFRGFSRAGCRVLLQVQARLENQFNVAVDVPGIASSILKTRHALLWMYRLLLRLVRPRAVFFASINYPERAAIEACKQAGIPVIELQHGVIGPYDLCYVFPRKAKLHCFPDYLFLYGPYWRECVDYPLPADRVIAVGNPYLEARLEEHGGVAKVDEAVVISQPTVGAELSRFAVELSRRASFPLRVVFRVHPYEIDWQTRYPWLRDSRVMISDSRREGIYAVLARARMQIGVYSAALFEGLAFGLPTYLVDLPGVEYMEPLLRKGWGRLVTRPEQIQAGRREDQTVHREQFFCNDSVQRFHRAVSSITQANFR
jgi:hypothetical protein